MSKLIYVNAGHGKGTSGKPDSGAVGPTGLKEADVTQDVADRLEHLLRAAGVQTDGTKVESLGEAVDDANAAKADLFVSLHCNSLSTKPQANGTETWYKGPKSKQLAEAVHARIMSYIAGPLGEWLPPTPLANRGIKSGNFYVIRATQMPSILVEMAFISNPREEALLRNKFFKQEMAQAICDGILAYLGAKKP